MKFLTPLLSLNSQKVEVQCLGFEVHIRRSKLYSRENART
jgi:hypothetical protein